MRKKLSFIAAVLTSAVLLCDEALDGFDAQRTGGQDDCARRRAGSRCCSRVMSPKPSTTVRSRVLLHRGQVQGSGPRAWGAPAAVLSLEREFLAVASTASA